MVTVCCHLVPAIFDVNGALGYNRLDPVVVEVRVEEAVTPAVAADADCGPAEAVAENTEYCSRLPARTRRPTADTKGLFIAMGAMPPRKAQSLTVNLK